MATDSGVVLCLFMAANVALLAAALVVTACTGTAPAERRLATGARR
jgi:hypothetical protein